MYGNKLYGAGKARDLRCKILKKLRVQRDTIPHRIKHGIDTFSVLDAEATEDQRKVHLRVLSEQKKAVKHLEEQLVILERCEAEILEYGFQLVDSFNGNETVSTLTPEEFAISEAGANCGTETGRISAEGPN